jgi:uncharacterized membrane protein
MISIFKIIGVIGLLILIYGTILVASRKKEKEQKVYWLFLIGGTFLLIYSFSLKDTIFTILQGVFILSTVWGLIKTK